MEPWAAGTLAEFELDIAPAAPTASLSLAQRQMLEVVQALLSRPKVLLLDEPTTALGHGDVERLHDLIRTLAPSGTAVVYVSHRLPEVLTVADRVTVLRDGVSQGTFDAAGDVRGRRRQADDRPPARARLPRRRRGSERRAARSRSTHLRGRRFGPVDLAAHAAVRSSASPGPRATARSSSSAPSPASSRRTARCAAPAGPSTCARRRGRCGPGSCCSARTARRSRSSPPSAYGPTPRSRCSSASPASASFAAPASGRRSTRWSAGCG